MENRQIANKKAPVTALNKKLTMNSIPYREGDSQMTQELITVKQLPIIEERLQSISEEVRAQTAAALALAVTEDTVKQVKKERAELSKSFKTLEEQRKAVKAAVMAPYMAFEEAYKRYVTDIFTSADRQLKMRIDEVEQTLLENKRNEVIAYFQEAAAERGIDFLAFDRLGIKVLLSDSSKKLYEQIDAALNRIANDLSAIATSEYPEETLIEYKDTLNLANAIMTVRTRHERIAAEMKRKEELRQKQAEPISPQATETKEPEPIPNMRPFPLIVTITINSPAEIQMVEAFCKANQLEYTIL